MKKQELLNTVNSSSLKKALEKDIDLIWEHANYEAFDYEETLKTLYYLGLEALPNFKLELNNLLKEELSKKPLTLIQKIKYIIWILRH